MKRFMVLLLVAACGGAMVVGPARADNSGDIQTTEYVIGSVGATLSALETELSSLVPYFAAGQSTSAGIYSSTALNFNNNVAGGNLVVGIGFLTNSSFATAAGYVYNQFGQSPNTINVTGNATGYYLIKPTLIGDNNLDGQVNAADVDLLSAGYSNTYSGATGPTSLANSWMAGDYNHDGKVDQVDVDLFAGLYGESGASLGAPVYADTYASALSYMGVVGGTQQTLTSGVTLGGAASAAGNSPSSVPEPGSVALLLAGGLFSALVFGFRKARRAGRQG